MYRYSSHVQELLSLLWTHVTELITQHKLNRYTQKRRLNISIKILSSTVEEVALSRAIPSNCVHREIE